MITLLHISLPLSRSRLFAGVRATGAASCMT